MSGAKLAQIMATLFTDLKPPYQIYQTDSVLETCTPASAIAEDSGAAYCRIREGDPRLSLITGRWGNIGATLQAVRDHKKTDPPGGCGDE